MLGVAEREGDTRWDPAMGAGAVEAHPGAYHDAIHVKRNTVELRLHNIFGQHSLLSRQIMRGGSWVLALELPAVESEGSQSARAITQTKAAERVEAPGLHPPPPPLAFNRLADLH